MADDGTILLYPTDEIFHQTERILVSGSSNTGKSFLIENLVRKFSKRFYKIVLCGNTNRLLEFPETKQITEYYTGKDPIYNPFLEVDSYDVKINQGKQLLIILDDLQEHIFKSEIVSKIFSRGRHLGISVIIVLQSYFVTGSGKNILPQIKLNCTYNIFTRIRSIGEIALIAQRLEHDKEARNFFIALFKKIVQEKRYAYLCVGLDVSDARIRYFNNLLSEDKSDFLTVYTHNVRPT